MCKQLVHIVWVDACTDDCYMDIDDIEMKLSKISTVGFIMNETPEIICVAQSIFIEDGVKQCSARSFIPKNCIVSRNDIAILADDCQEDGEDDCQDKVHTDSCPCSCLCPCPCSQHSYDHDCEKMEKKEKYNSHLSGFVHDDSCPYYDLCPDENCKCICTCEKEEKKIGCGDCNVTPCECEFIPEQDREPVKEDICRTPDDHSKYCTCGDPHEPCNLGNKG